MELARGLDTLSASCSCWPAPPILRDNDLLGGRSGRYLLAAGAVGELFPIFAIALFLRASNKFVALGSLAPVGCWPWS